MLEESLLEILRANMRSDLARTDRVAVAYSGGIDSSIIATLAKEFACVTCAVCAVEGSFDAVSAERRAEEDDLSLKVLTLSPSILRERVAIASGILGTSDPVPIAYTIPLISVVAESAESIILAGNGADELFGGYAKYLMARDPGAMMAEDLNKMLEEAKRLGSWARRASKKLVFPYAEGRVIAFSRDLPPNQKIDGAERKVLLRKVARLLELRSSDRPKKAAQYSSGVLRLMERSAKEMRLSLAEWTAATIESSCRSSYERAENLPTNELR